MARSTGSVPDHISRARFLEKNLATAAGSAGTHMSDTATLMTRFDPIVERILAGHTTTDELVQAARSHGRGTPGDIDRHL